MFWKSTGQKESQFVRINNLGDLTSGGELEALSAGEKKG
jgi:hypothetical protein